MSTLPHHKYPLRSPRHARKSHYSLLPSRIRCSPTTTTTTTTPTPKPTRNPNKPILKSNLITPPSLAAAADPNLQSTWAHRAWLTTGCTTVLVSLAKSTIGAAHSHIWVQPLLAGVVGYVLADLGSGVYHWSIDNYGSGSTPVFGTQIEAFQGHHNHPWTITKRQFANNLHALARVITFIVLPLDLIINDPIMHAFIGVCSGCIMFSQQFHAWAHGTKSRLPPPVVALQDAGLLVSRTNHSAHHRPPYNNNYCIVSGVWNEFLDKQKVFEVMEMILFFKLGIRPRCWSEPNSEWAEQIETVSSQSISN